MAFIQLKLTPEIEKGINVLGFKEPTPVQRETIPHAIKGKDIRACAQTGTGKTCAFAIPLLNQLSKKETPSKPTALILVPTRELGTQVVTVIKDVAQFTEIKSVLIMGGANMQKQVRQIKAGAQIVVATPGRLLDHMSRRTISLRNIKHVILDEADRMLDMGFLPDIREILSSCPKERQTMLFSATFPEEIARLASRFLKDPVVVDLAPSQPAATIKQVVYPVSRRQKEDFMKALLEYTHFRTALVFCRTKHGADHLARFLQKLGKKVGVIHSNLNQSQRDNALKDFKSKKVQFLVATDIAARGIDVKDITHVVNFDVPENPEDYVHRIGRTGRAEAKGDAITLVAPDEEVYMRRILTLIKKPVERAALPNFPYLVPPQLNPKKTPLHEKFGKIRRRIPTSRSRFGR